MDTKTQATIEDLSRVPEHGKAEIVRGKVVLMPPTGFGHGRITDRIRDALLLYERQTRAGYALSDNVAFVVSLPDRTTFSPDAAFTAQRPDNDEDFVIGAPIFAAEVRSKHDYRPNADEEYRQKRADYFAAGTHVVWDVNPRSRMILSYRADAPDAPITFRMGDEADAEPALPGWRVRVHEILSE